MIRTLFVASCALLSGISGHAQYPTSCAAVGQRSNSNGGANSCPNVSASPYALNFLATTYATVPSGSKTGNFQLSYSGADPTLEPYAITQVWLTTTGTSVLSVSFGPAGVPTISGSTTQVNYCFYGSNLPNAGTLSFQLTNPQTGTVAGICSYDASCNSNCAVVANPVILPVTFAGFTAAALPDGSIRLNWSTAQELNNKGFFIERSATDSSFSPVAFVPSSNSGGNSSLPTAYTYTDNDPHAVGHIEYRLKQEDLNGFAVYSQVVAVEIHPSTTEPTIFAAGSAIKVQLPPTAEAAQIFIYDTQGKTLKRVAAAAGSSATIDGLPPRGIYYIAVRSLNGKPMGIKAVWLE